MTDPRIPNPVPLTPEEQQRREDAAYRYDEAWERDQDRNGPFETVHLSTRSLKLEAARQCLRSINEDAETVDDCRLAARLALDALKDVA